MITELKYYFIENKYVMKRLVISMLIIIFVLFFALFTAYVTPKVVESTKGYMDFESVYSVNGDPLIQKEYDQEKLIEYKLYRSNNNYWYIESEDSDFFNELGAYKFNNDNFNGAVVSKEFIVDEMGLSTPEEAFGMSYMHRFQLPLTKEYFEYVEITFTIVNYYEDVPMVFGIKNSGFYITGDPGNKIFVPNIGEVIHNIYYGYVFRFNETPSNEKVNQIITDNQLDEEWTYSYNSEVTRLSLIYDPILRGIITISNGLLAVSFVVYIFALLLILNITKNSFNLRYLLGASSNQLLTFKLLYFTLIISIAMIVSFIVNLMVFGLLAKANGITTLIIDMDIIYYTVFWYLLMLIGIGISSIVTNKYNLYKYIR